MKRRRGKEVAVFASGIVLGTALAAPVAGAALTAQVSSQKIVIRRPACVPNFVRSFFFPLP